MTKQYVIVIEPTKMKWGGESEVVRLRRLLKAIVRTYGFSVVSLDERVHDARDKAQQGE